MSPFSTIQALLSHNYNEKEFTNPTQPTKQKGVDILSSRAISQFKMNGTGMLEGQNLQGLIQD